MSIRTIIVDDEPLARDRLTRLLADIQDVQVIAAGSNGQQAVDLVSKHQPDLVFLDINMPIKNGLAAAQEIVQLPIQSPAIVFCTAYDQFAVDAFKTQAAAYLLKPVSVEELRVAIEKASKLSQLQISALMQSSELDVRLKVQHQNFVEMKLASDFIYFRSEDKRVVAASYDGPEVLIERSLKQLEEDLKTGFVRVHRNSLLNKTSLSRMLKDDEGHTYVEIDGSQRIFPVSRRHLPEVRKYFR